MDTGAGRRDGHGSAGAGRVKQAMDWYKAAAKHLTVDADLSGPPCSAEMLKQCHGPCHQVPANSYELNFVLSDGEGRFENNSGQDFKFAVEGGRAARVWVALTRRRGLWGH